MQLLILVLLAIVLIFALIAQFLGTLPAVVAELTK